MLHATYKECKKTLNIRHKKPTFWLVWAVHRIPKVTAISSFVAPWRSNMLMTPCTSYRGCRHPLVDSDFNAFSLWSTLIVPEGAKQASKRGNQPTFQLSCDAYTAKQRVAWTNSPKGTVVWHVDHDGNQQLFK